MKKTWATLILVIVAMAHVQAQKADTVIVSLGNSSKVVFTMQDRSDIEILKYYNFQDLFEDILDRIEASDSNAVQANENEVAREESREEEEAWRSSDDSDRDDDDEEEWSREEKHRRGRIGRTWQTTNLDLGINNYLSESDQFPDRNENHSVRPWGSWYLGINSLQRTKAGRNFFIEWGLGVSWYNFKFQNDLMTLNSTPEEVSFSPVLANPEYDYIKSKLRVTYINASLVPVLDFGNRGRRARIWDSYGSQFRIGIGPYVGYKIGSKSKTVYLDEEDHRKKEKNRDSFYLNDLRYGARLQVGFRSTDFFINYDANELFKEGHGPKLNAVSFGIIF